MKILFILISLSVFASCGSIGNFVAKQKRIETAAAEHVYSIPISEFKDNLIDYFGGWRTASIKNDRHQKKIDAGFVWKGSYFKKRDLTFSEIINSLSGNEKKNLGKFFTENNFHTIEDNSKEFILVFEGVLYKGISIEKNKTKIEVYSFDKLEYGSYKLDVNYLALFTRHASLIDIKTGPVLLDKSMKYAHRVPLIETDIFHNLDVKSYEMVK